MATKKYTQEQLLEYSPHLYESEKKTYWKELEKYGYFQTTTKNKIEKIYKDNHFGVAWIGRGENKMLKVGKKKPNPIRRIDNRGGNYTEYAEKGAQLLARHIYEANQKNVTGSTFLELSMTRIQWLSVINFTKNIEDAKPIFSNIENEIKKLSIELGINDSKIRQIINNVSDSYKTSKKLFYREIFTSISNYLKNVYKLDFYDKYYVLFFSDEYDFLSEKAEDTYSLYLENMESTETYSGLKAKLNKDHEEEIKRHQKNLLSQYTVTPKDLMWKKNSESVQNYLEDESKLLREQYHIKRVWKQKTVKNPDSLRKFQYGIKKREKDMEIVRNQLEKRWKNRMENVNKPNSFKGIFMLYYFNYIESRLNWERFNSNEFFAIHDQHINDKTTEMVELFGADALNVEISNDDEAIYYNMLLRLKENAQY